MSIININAFMLDKDVDIVNTIYTVMSTYVGDEEEPLQTYTTTQIYIGTTVAAVLWFVVAVEVAAVYWVGAAIIAGVVLA